MISVEEAIQILAEKKHDFGIEEISIDQCTNRILRENIIADRDMPPFDRVSMDGIAIRYEGFENGIRIFPIIGMAAAGSAQQTLADAGHCYEIMTGSINPLGADTIIPYEWLSIKNEVATVVKENVIKGQNIHRKGTDRKEGDLLITSGRHIAASEVGVLASVGKTKVKVSRLPKVIIISTGNELVAINQEPLPHQVRMSNVYQLYAALLQLEIEPERSHLQDEYEMVKNALAQYLNKYNVIILSGGVSEGKYDYVRPVLDSLGVQQHYYKIRQRPGMPFWFGTYKNNCCVFAVPGNPVSSFMCYTRYVRPWLESCMLKEPQQLSFAILAEDVKFTPDLTHFLTVRLKQNDLGEMMAIPVKGHGSGDLSNLVDVDAFMELPRGREDFKKGEVFTVFRF